MCFDMHNLRFFCCMMCIAHALVKNYNSYCNNEIDKADDVKACSTTMCAVCIRRHHSLSPTTE